MMLLFLSWFLTCNGTKWPKLCLCAVKKLLTHSLTQWAWLGLHDLFKKFCGPVVYHDLGMSDARYELKLLDDTELF